MINTAKRARARSVAGWLAVMCVLVLAGACGDEISSSSDRGRPGAKPAAPAAAAAAAGAGTAEKPGTDTLTFKDDDFVESEHNRDPFRYYVSAFRTRGPDAVGGDPQRPVIMPTTNVEAMKLIAIISGLTRPKAMLVDQFGVGYVVERGDYIGRAKVLQATGSVSMTLNWRVDRIRENEVVLTRADPTDPGRPPMSRIISMRGEKAD